MDSCGDSYYDDSVFDDYDNLKVTSDIDSDYGQFHSFCLSSGISGSNKQSKANRRRFVVVFHDFLTCYRVTSFITSTKFSFQGEGTTVQVFFHGWIMPSWK